MSPTRAVFASPPHGSSTSICMEQDRLEALYPWLLRPSSGARLPPGGLTFAASSSFIAHSSSGWGQAHAAGAVAVGPRVVSPADRQTLDVAGGQSYPPVQRKRQPGGNPHRWLVPHPAVPVGHEHAAARTVQMRADL